MAVRRLAQAERAVVTGYHEAPPVGELFAPEHVVSLSPRLRVGSVLGAAERRGVRRQPRLRVVARLERARSWSA